MNMWAKVSVCIALFFMCLCTCVGYASVSSTYLHVNGTAHVDAPKYDEIVITRVEACAATNATQTAGVIPFTNVKSTISGSSGQKIVYKITAHNYSESLTYVFGGAIYDDQYAAVADKLTLSVSSDEKGTQTIPATVGTNYYEGTPVAPGEEIVFYATYTLKASVSGEIMVNFKFVPVQYSVTYLVDNETYAVDCIVDNTKAYKVRTSGPSKEQMKFTSWINANADSVASYPAGNTNSYTLSAKWENVYLIIFVDDDGSVFYQESFTNSTTALSANGQSIVNTKLAELAKEAAKSDMTVSWSEYDIKNAKEDIIVRPLYTYNGNLQYTPVDEDGDGIIDYYQLDAVDALDAEVTILGQFHGLPVKVVNKLYANDGNFDYSSGVKTVIIQEGVQILNHNSLAYTESLQTVYLPNSLTEMANNVFSRNWGDDKKAVTIYYNGTKAEWKALLNNSNSKWHNGLQKNTKVICTDGYFVLTNVSLFGTYTWKEY